MAVLCIQDFLLKIVPLLPHPPPLPPFLPSQKNAPSLSGPLVTRQKKRNATGRNEHRFQQNLTVYIRKFCNGTDEKTTRSSENRGTDKDR